MRETKLSRRSFLKGLVAGVATVAIASKMAPKLTIAEEPLRYKATERYSTAWSDARAAYGSIGDRYAQALAHSLEQTKEQVSANVLNNAFSQPSYVGKSYGTQYTLLEDDDGLVHEMYEDQAEGFIHNVYPNGTNHLKAEHLADYLEAISAEA